MGWGTRKEYCETFGISVPTFKRRKGKGLIQWRYGASGRGGEAGKHIEVFINDAEILRSGDAEKKTKDDKLKKISSKWQPTVGITKIARGEPGCRVETTLENGTPILNAECGMRNAESENKEVIKGDSPSVNLGQSPKHNKETGSFLQPGALRLSNKSGDGNSAGGKDPGVLNLPAVIGGDSPESQNKGTVPAVPTVSTVSPRCNQIANLRFALIQKFNEEFTKDYPQTLPLFKNGNGRPSKTKIIQKFLDLYNSGLILPEIHKTLKTVKRSTLYDWLHIYNDSGITGLVPQYNQNAFSKVLQTEKDFLLKFLLNQNKKTIADAIRECKRYLGSFSPSAPTTLRRFVNDFKNQYHDVWTLEREGEKAWNDKDAPYQDRDPMSLYVGEVLVADGHKLNFRVKDPITGKEKRPVLVMFWDWKSAYPVGWEIMMTENIQCITGALRNALLTLGKIPRYVYIDNGKAFLSKIFTRKIIVEET
jgi:transposase